MPELLIPPNTKLDNKERSRHMSEKTIEQELCGALVTKRKSTEHRQDYLYRLVRATQKMKDDEWNALRESPTQEWVNKNLELLNKGRDANKKDNKIDLDDFPDREETEDEVNTETEDEVNTETTADEKPARKKMAAKEADDKPTKADKSAKADDKPEKVKSKKAATANGGDKPERKTATKEKGSRLLIKELLIEDPTMSTDDLVVKLEKKGLTPTKLATSTLRSGTLQSYRLLLAQPMDKIRELKKALGV